MAAAIYGLTRPDSVTTSTAALLIVALIAVQIERVVEISVLGNTVKLTELRELQDQLSQVKGVVRDLEKAGGPGGEGLYSETLKRPKGKPLDGDAARDNPKPVSPLGASASMRAVDVWNEDPNKGSFGGQAERDGFLLSAKITPLRGKQSALCEIAFKVSTTKKDADLGDEIKVFLHPTFGRYASYPLEVEDGVALDKIKAVGAFTIGVETKSGVKLELDLAGVEGGTKSFYQN
jgi:hypothetical protein